MVKRKAIAMIELIVAIVIMGIAFLAIPMINNTAIQSGENAMLQESVAASASQIELIFTRSWDNTNVGGNGVILQTDSINFTTLAGLNPGSRKIDIVTPQLASAILGIEGAVFDDMDDFNGQAIALSVYNTDATTYETYQGDYADKNISMATNVQYVNDGFATGQIMNGVDPFSSGVAGGSSNIKLITSTLSTTANTGSDTIDNKRITLRAFACNIGTVTVSRTPGDN